jgi:thiol:disulfide interchange protein DsbD
MGMIAFSTAFSLPFFFLALFPDLLTRLPRSGAWMSQVKVFMGFVELAAAVKFLSNMDLVWGFGLLTQPVFIAVWVLICAVAGLQLLGWLRMGNEQPSPIGWLRRGFGVASLGTAGYLLAALNGAPLSEIAAFLPPDPYPGRASAVAASGPIAWRHIYDEALAAAKAEGKPLFINFTGVT